MSMKQIMTTALLVLGCGVAEANLVQNGSFELTTATTTSQFIASGVVVNNWTNGGSAGEAIVLPSWFTNGYLTVPTVTFDGPVTQSSPDGGNFVFSDGDFMNTPITQTVTGLIPTQAYQVTFWQALAQDKEPNVTTPGNVSGYWRVSLGSSILNSPMMFANGSISGPGSAVWSPWKQQTMVFTAQNASEVLSFFSVGTGDPPLVLLDGITLNLADSGTVPTPGSLGLLASACVGLGAFYRRTRWRQLNSTTRAHG